MKNKKYEGEEIKEIKLLRNIQILRFLYEKIKPSFTLSPLRRQSNFIFWNIGKQIAPHTVSSQRQKGMMMIKNVLQNL